MMKFSSDKIKNKIKFLLYTIFTSALLFSKQSHSQILDSSFYSWTVYEIQENELDYNKKCYIISHPTKSDSDYTSRKKPYIMITRFQGERVEEVSINSGFEYKLNSEIFLMINSDQFKLKTKNDIAWAKTRREDIEIINSILRGNVAVVRSDSSLGYYAVDEYSLKGLVKAYYRMREICK